MEYVEIDLSRLIKYYNGISNVRNYELDIVKNYSYHVSVDINTIKKVIGIMLTDSYGDSGYPELELNTFYKIDKVYNSMEKFLEVLEFLVLHKVNPYFEDIVFDSIVEDTDSKLVVKFCVTL